jgi:hypothetical protein
MPAKDKYHHAVVKDANIRLLVFDPVKEEIIQWQN